MSVRIINVDWAWWFASIHCKIHQTRYFWSAAQSSKNQSLLIHVIKSKFRRLFINLIQTAVESKIQRKWILTQI